jgi:hypothetical protein
MALMTKDSESPRFPGTCARRASILSMAGILLGLVGESDGLAAAQSPARRALTPRSVAPRSGRHAPLRVSELARRIVTVSARYLGTPYRLDPLGEGPSAVPDPDPLICRNAVDCQTFVEQVLAEAMAPETADALSLLTRIRYRNGVIGFGSRNHYLVSDWLPRNRWCLRDLTALIGVQQVRSMEKVIDRPAFFRSRGAPGLARAAAFERSQTLYIPRGAVPGIATSIPNGSVLIWVQDRPGIIAAHCGLAVRQGKGALRFRHASQRRGRVVDEPLADYLHRAPARIVGLKVCQATPPLDTTSGSR